MNRTSSKQRRLSAFAVVSLSAALVTSPTLSAQEKATSVPKSSKSPSVDMPTGESLMDAYAEAVGAKNSRKEFTSRRSEGTMEMKAAGISGKLSILQEAPNKFVLKMELPGIGDIQQGTDGEIAWEASALSGNRTLTGEEKKEMMRRAIFSADADWKELYSAATTVGAERVGEKDTWVVELKPKDSDKVQTNYYDKATRLLVQSKMQVESPMGVISVEATFEDFREVDGIKMPFTTTQKVLGQTQMILLSKVTHNEKMPAGAFDKPKK